MAQANPSLFAGHRKTGSVPLPAGTVLVVPPNLPPPEERTASGRASTETPGRPSKKRTGESSAVTTTAVPGKDRLLYGVGRFSCRVARSPTLFLQTFDPWEYDPSSSQPRSLLEFQRVIATLQEVWHRKDKSECEAYLNDLLTDTRENTRTGFPQEVAEEISMLLKILRSLD